MKKLALLLAVCLIAWSLGRLPDPARPVLGGDKRFRRFRQLRGPAGIFPPRGGPGGRLRQQRL